MAGEIFGLSLRSRRLATLYWVSVRWVLNVKTAPKVEWPPTRSALEHDRTAIELEVQLREGSWTWIIVASLQTVDRRQLWQWMMLSVRGHVQTSKETKAGSRRLRQAEATSASGMNYKEMFSLNDVPDFKNPRSISWEREQGSGLLVISTLSNSLVASIPTSIIVPSADHRNALIDLLQVQSRNSQLICLAEASFVGFKRFVTSKHSHHLNRQQFYGKTLPLIASVRYTHINIRNVTFSNLKRLTLWASEVLRKTFICISSTLLLIPLLASQINKKNLYKVWDSSFVTPPMFLPNMRWQRKLLFLRVCEVHYVHSIRTWWNDEKTD